MAASGALTSARRHTWLVADPRRFPALTAFIAARVFEAEDGPDDEFIFGLDRILDGVEALIQPRPRPG